MTANMSGKKAGLPPSTMQQAMGPALNPGQPPSMVGMAPMQLFHQAQFMNYMQQTATGVAVAPTTTNGQLYQCAMPPVIPVAAKPPGKKGKKAQVTQFTKVETTLLLDCVEQFAPIGQIAWQSVADNFNARVPEHRMRDQKALSNKFQRLHTRNVPTGDPFIPPDVLRAKRINKSIQEKAGVIDAEDVSEESGLLDASDRDEEEEERKETEEGKEEENTEAPVPLEVPQTLEVPFIPCAEPPINGDPLLDPQDDVEPGEFVDVPTVAAVAATPAGRGNESSSLSGATAASTTRKNEGGRPKGSKNKPKAAAAPAPAPAPETSQLLEAFVLSEKLASKRMMKHDRMKEKRDRRKEKARNKRDRRQMKMLFGLVATACASMGGKIPDDQSANVINAMMESSSSSESESEGSGSDNESVAATRKKKKKNEDAEK